MNIQNSDHVITRSHQLLTDKNLIEEVTLIWLDKNAKQDTVESLDTRSLLLKTNAGHCLFYDNVSEFLVATKERRDQNEILLIVVSGALLAEIPSDMMNIPLIIFCENCDRYLQYKARHKNIIGICTDFEKLNETVKKELKFLSSNSLNDTHLQSFMPLCSSDNFEMKSAYFSYMIFIDLVKQAPQTPSSMNDMLNKCLKYHRWNEKQREHIQEFEKTYKSEDAITWYTKDRFVYRLVNQAFRTDDVTLWYLFRFYIVDLSKKIEQDHKTQNIETDLKLYRGQIMSTDEFEYLKMNKNGIFATNGFFSTSKDFDVAHQFAVTFNETDQRKPVMFEITVEGINLRSTVFVDTKEYGNAGEQEILFNIGSVFKIGDADYNENWKSYRIQMKATDEINDKIQKEMERIKRKFQDGNINFVFGRLLLEMNEYVKAESYFKRLLEMPSSISKDRPTIYDFIAKLNMQISNWKEAFKYFELSYEMMKKTLHSKHPRFGPTLYSIGNYYRAIGDHNHAMTYYKKALKYYSDLHARAIIQMNIGTIHLLNKNYKLAKASYTDTHTTLQGLDPCPYDDVARCLRMMGDYYLDLKNFDDAEAFYLTAFEMSKTFSLSGNGIRIECIKALARLYDKRTLKQQAIEFCDTQLRFYEKDSFQSQISRAHLLMTIAGLYNDDNSERINILEKAWSILKKNVYIHYATSADCLYMMADYYHKRRMKEEAYGHAINALEVRRKIYPDNHSIIPATENLVEAIKSSK